MSDPRERVIRLGNELLDALFDYESRRSAGGELMEKVGAGGALPSGAIHEVVLPLLKAEQRYDRARQAYLAVREVVESFEARR